MPRRSVDRCPRKSTTTLDLIDEFNLVLWSPILPGRQFKTLAAMRDAWDRHGSDILPHYVRQRPGTRPFAMYVLGELPLPPLLHPPVKWSLEFTIDGVRFHDQWHYFGSCTGPGGYYHGGSTYGEFQYLRRLGVIDDAEAELADEWIDDRYHAEGRDRRTYRPLSAD